MRKWVCGVLAVLCLVTLAACSKQEEKTKTQTVDLQALADALNSGHLAGAAVDVFETEPPLDTAHPLLHSKNTLVTPHVAFASAESMQARAQIVFDNISSFLAGEQKNIIL